MTDDLHSDLVNYWLSSEHHHYLLLALVDSPEGEDLFLLAASKAFRTEHTFLAGHRLLGQRYGHAMCQTLLQCLRHRHTWMGHTDASNTLLAAWPVGDYLVVYEAAQEAKGKRMYRPPSRGDADTNTSRIPVSTPYTQELLIGLNSKGAIQYVSEEVQHLLQRPADQIIGMNMEALIHHRDIAHFRNLINEARAKQTAAHGEFRLRLPSGPIFVFQWTIAYHGPNALLIGKQNDRNLEAALVRSEERLNLILETIEDAFLAVDSEWRLSYVNKKGAALLGKPPASLLGRSLWDCAPQLQETEAFVEFNRAVSSQKPTIFHTQLGEEDKWYQGKACPNQEGVSIFFTDITSIKKSEEQMRHQALHDALTGLPNRLSITVDLKEMIRKAQGSERRVGLLFIDLDGFKSVNDTLGHDAGDELLKCVAKRMRDTVRQVDVVARLSGDEFIIALNNVVSTDIAFSIGRKIVDTLSRQPYALGKDKVYIGASIGVAVFPEDAGDPESLLKHADMAMYDAKQAGKNTVRVYKQHMSAELSERVALENSLRDALEHQRIFVQYQPRFNNRGHIVGMEALARLREEDGQIIWPSHFIPVAEETGLITTLGERVLKLACMEVARWNRRFQCQVGVSVNVSGLQLLSAEFEQVVNEALTAAQLPVELLELELTETTLMQSGSGAIDLLKTIESKGIKVSVDDFGTGYSSLSLLQQLPVSILKIDASFTRGLPDDRATTALVKGIIAMAQALGLSTVAEGVETQSQHDALIALGVDELQGYYLGRPISSEQMQLLLEQTFTTLIKH